MISLREHSKKDCIYTIANLYCHYDNREKTMRNANKLGVINQKIAELTRQQKTIESKIIDSLSKRIANILIKRHLTNIDVPAFLKKVENIIDEMNAK
jgi:hypothetical protein